jgi:hypothetical protein
MRQFLLVFMMLLLCASATSCGPNYDTENGAIMQTIAHPNGLVVTFGETWTARQTKAGYEVEPPGADHFRYSAVIEVRLEDGPEPAALDKSLTVDGIRIHYRIESIGTGGSGGEEYVMTASRPCSGKHILVIQPAQAELEQELDFRKGYQIAAHAKCNN